MEHKHTPGPWNARHVRRSGNGSARIDIDGPSMAWVAEVKIGPNFQQAMADARLIAAAPDLLEALQATLAQCLAWQGEPNEYSCEVHSEIIRHARAALAKATGEQG